MTLIELRDPKQPILRELQQRAPGTYNHSLNVAAIAETASDAIGADALLTYVGGLYHAPLLGHDLDSVKNLLVSNCFGYGS